MNDVFEPRGRVDSPEAASGAAAPLRRIFCAGRIASLFELRVKAV